MARKQWMEQVVNAQRETTPKIGAGHAQAWLRLGAKELAQFLPAFNNGQQIVEEPGLAGNLTPGEVMKGKDHDVQLDANQEPKHSKEQDRGGMEM